MASLLPAETVPGRSVRGLRGSWMLKMSPFSDGLKGSLCVCRGWGVHWPERGHGTFGEIHQEGRSLTRINTFDVGCYWGRSILADQAPGVLCKQELHGGKSRGPLLGDGSYSLVLSPPGVWKQDRTGIGLASRIIHH